MLVIVVAITECIIMTSMLTDEVLMNWANNNLMMFSELERDPCLKVPVTPMRTRANSLYSEHLGDFLPISMDGCLKFLAQEPEDLQEYLRRKEEVQDREAMCSHFTTTPPKSPRESCRSNASTFVSKGKMLLPHYGSTSKVLSVSKTPEILKPSRSYSADPECILKHRKERPSNASHIAVKRTLATPIFRSENGELDRFALAKELELISQQLVALSSKAELLQRSLESSQICSLNTAKVYPQLCLSCRDVVTGKRKYAGIMEAQEPANQDSHYKKRKLCVKRMDGRSRSSSKQERTNGGMDTKETK